MSVILSGTIIVGHSEGDVADHPRFCYQNHFRSGTVSVSSEQSDHPREHATDWFTHTAWIGEEGQGAWWIRLDRVSTQADYAGMLIHNPQSLSVRLQYSEDGTEWEDIADHVSPTDRVLTFLFDQQTHDHWRVLFEGDEPPAVADISLGLAMVAETGFSVGLEPPRQARNNEIMNNTTDTGNFVGRSLIKRGIATQVSMSVLSEHWVRDEWEPFIDHAELYPFYVIWSPARFPGEAAFVWTDGRIRAPRYSNAAGWMDVNLSIEGFAR